MKGAMRDIFILTKNLELPNYLFLILREIANGEDLRLTPEYHDDVSFIIVDTESVDLESIRRYPKTPKVLFSYEIKPFLLQYTKAFDINGVISLGMESSDILTTIKAAIDRDIFYSDSMISMLFSNKTNELSERIDSLTDRELEIMNLMILDDTNEEIASRLNLSVRTVNAHKGNIMRKVGAKTTGGLIKKVTDYSAKLKNQS